MRFSERKGAEKAIFGGKCHHKCVWDQETVRSSRTTRTKIPLKSLISEGFFLFFVYCDAKSEE